MIEILKIIKLYVSLKISLTQFSFFFINDNKKKLKLKKKYSHLKKKIIQIIKLFVSIKLGLHNLILTDFSKFPPINNQYTRACLSLD